MQMGPLLESLWALPFLCALFVPEVEMVCLCHEKNCLVDVLGLLLVKPFPLS